MISYKKRLGIVGKRDFEFFGLRTLHCVHLSEVVNLLEDCQRRCDPMGDKYPSFLAKGVPECTNVLRSDIQSPFLLLLVKLCLDRGYNGLTDGQSVESAMEEFLRSCLPIFIIVASLSLARSKDTRDSNSLGSQITLIK